MTSPPSKIDPVTAIQDSIDSLALSLFEALRTVRDTIVSRPLSDAEPIDPSEQWKNLVPDGMDPPPPEYFGRAFDIMEPDYDAFVLGYLSGVEESKELVEKFRGWNYEGEGERKCREITDGLSNGEVKSVGYRFRKHFDAGWVEGEVVEIRPQAENGKDRRVEYTNGDVEDLSLDDLQELARLEPPTKKTRLSIKLKPNRDTPGETDREKCFPRNEREYIRLLQRFELERDEQMTRTLGEDILAKSAIVDGLVAGLPGLCRTRPMQLERIGELMRVNSERERELEEMVGVAEGRREEVRVALEECTCLALELES